MGHKLTIEKEDVRAVILAGGGDFGRSSAARRLPTALWPVTGRPALERLLRYLSAQGLRHASVCCNGDASLLGSSLSPANNMKVRFLEGKLPIGSAGCIREAVRDENSALIVLFPAQVVQPPKIEALIKTHRKAKADLTVFFNPPERNGDELGQSTGIYVFDPGVVEYIPEEGYFDIKEGLVPELVRAGKSVQAAVLPQHAGNFWNRQTYLESVGSCLEHTAKVDGDLQLYRGSNWQTVWRGTGVTIEPSARFYGPVVIMDGARVCDGAVIFGPAVLGRNVTVGKNTVIVDSVFWDGAKTGSNCRIERSLVDYNAVVPDNAVVEEQSVLLKGQPVLARLTKGTMGAVVSGARTAAQAVKASLAKIDEKISVLTRHNRIVAGWIAGALVVAAFFWSYRSGILDLWGIWQRSDEYSSGFLVPFLAVYIVWSRRRKIAGIPIRPCLWGIFAFIGAQAVRLFGLYFMYGSAERLSIALSIAALVLLLFGWAMFKKLATVLLFCCLMLPWPNRIQAAVSLPLQHWSTSSAVFLLEMLGYEVIQEGNIIHIGDTYVAVAEACNGLRMVMAFFVIAGLVVLLARRSWWEKLIVLLSSLPIALLCNTVRLAITAIAFTVLAGEQWGQVFHDFGGYAMMPLALGAVVGELWLLRRLTTTRVQEQALLIKRKGVGDESYKKHTFKGE